MIQNPHKESATTRAVNARLQQVTQWLNKEFIVIDGVLYSPRRKLNKAT